MKRTMSWPKVHALFLPEPMVSKKRLLEFISKVIAAPCGLEAEQILTALQEREQVGCTAIGHGVALPHARIKALKAPTSLWLLLQHPLAYDDAEAPLIDIVLVLLVPEDKNSEYLQLLQQGLVMVRRAKARIKIRSCRSNQDLLICIHQLLGLPLES